jgi:hypothetical protein
MHWHLALWQKITGGLLKASRYKKEIIDLQDKKIAILKEENAILAREKSELKAKTAGLEKELGGVRPKNQMLDEIQINFLGLLFNQDLPVKTIAQQLGINEGLANYHKDVLMEARMVQWTNIGVKSEWMGTNKPATLGISEKGRAYLVENKLVR